MPTNLQMVLAHFFSSSASEWWLCARPFFTMFLRTRPTMRWLECVFEVWNVTDWWTPLKKMQIFWSHLWAFLLICFFALSEKRILHCILDFVPFQLTVLVLRHHVLCVKTSQKSQSAFQFPAQMVGSHDRRFQLARADAALCVGGSVAFWVDIIDLQFMCGGDFWTFGIVWKCLLSSCCVSAHIWSWLDFAGSQKRNPLIFRHLAFRPREVNELFVMGKSWSYSNGLYFQLVRSEVLH